MHDDGPSLSLVSVELLNIRLENEQTFLNISWEIPWLVT